MDELSIGDPITLEGRIFTVRGFDPMSIPEQTVELVEVETGLAIRVPLAHLRRCGADVANTRYERRVGYDDFPA